MSGFQRFFFETSLSEGEFDDGVGAVSSVGGLLKIPVGGVTQGSRAEGGWNAGEPGGPAPYPIEFWSCMFAVRS
jgi:hypothetical protein